jgi:hypothetical protein
MLNTRIATAKMLSTVLRLGGSQGTAKGFRIGGAHKPDKARFAFRRPTGKENLTALPLNKFLEIGLG